MSSQSSFIITNDSGFSGTDDRQLVRKPSQDDVIHLDGVTLQGFDPGSVSVVRTTTTKVTKTTRSRSPSPVRVRRLSSEGSPRLARSGSAGSTPGRIRMRVVPSGHDSESESSEIIMPTFATGVTHSSPSKKAPNKDASSGWRPIPFSSPPVPPPPGDVTDTEEVPKVPPKPKSVKTNIWLSANQPSQEQGSPTSPPMSPTNGFPMSPSEQKGWVLTDMTTGFLPKSRGAALFERRKRLSEERERGGVPPPPVMDIPNNNNNLRKDEDEFWPLPPPPDESVWSPPSGDPSRGPAPAQSVPPPPPEKDEGIAPVWTPGGSQPVKKEFKPVKLDLTNRPKVSSAIAPFRRQSTEKMAYSLSTPAAHTWTPPNQGATSPKPITPQVDKPQYTQPVAVDTLPDPSHILSPGYVSPRSSMQESHPPPPPQFAGDGPTSPHPPASPHPSVSRGVPVSPAGAVPYQPRESVPYDGMSNGYGFIPASAVMSGSPGAIQSDLLTWGIQPGPAPPPSTNDNSTIILDPSNLPPGALFQKQTVDGDVVHTDTFYPVSNMTRKTSTVTKHEAPNYDGIGPRDKDGLPLGLRQHVKEDNRHDWYKEMFKSIHKQDRDEDDSDDISLPQNVEEDSSDSVFLSENEAVHAHVKDDWKRDERSTEPEHVVKNTPSYRVQPGRIQDFVPGKSALAAHEKSVLSRKDGPLYDGGRRGSAPGSGYASDEEARKAYHSFVKSGELPGTAGFGFGAPQARRATDISFPTNSSSNLHVHVIGKEKVVDGFSSPICSSTVCFIRCSGHLGNGVARTPLCMSTFSTPAKGVCCEVAGKDIDDCSCTQIQIKDRPSELFREILEPPRDKEGTNLTSLHISFKENASFESKIFKPLGVFRKPRLDIGGSPFPHPMPVMPRNPDTEEEDAEAFSKAPSRPSRIQYRINSSKEKVKHKRSSSAPRLLGSTSDGDNQIRKPVYQRSASSSGSTSGVVQSPAADPESYHKYAAGLQQASQRTKRYQDLVNFYSNLNKHLDESDKEKEKTMAEKYLPSSTQLEKFYSTLHLYMEMEMAAAHGQTFVNENFEELRWSVDKERDFKRRELNIDDLHSFYTKLHCGLNVDKKSEEKLERLKKKVYAEKMRHVSQKEKDVGQLQEHYEGILSGRSTPVPKSPMRQTVSLPATPVRYRTPVSWEEEADAEKKEVISEPEAEGDHDDKPAVQRFHSVERETEIAPRKTQSTESRPPFTRFLSEPDWRSKLAQRYSNSVYEEDLLLMPALLKDAKQWEQFSQSENEKPQDKDATPSIAGDVNEQKQKQTELNCEFISPSEVELSHSNWKDDISIPNKSNKDEPTKGTIYPTTFKNKHLVSQKSQESDSTVIDNSSRRPYHHSSSFEQDASPLTLRSKPINTAEVKPFQRSESLSDSPSLTLPNFRSPVSSPRSASPNSSDSTEHRDFNPRPRPFSNSRTVGSNIVTVSTALPLSSSVFNTKQSSDIQTSATDFSDVTDQAEHTPSIDRVNLSLPFRSLSMPASTPAVIVHTPSSEEDEWLETYDKVKDAWEDSISAFEAKKQEREGDNTSSQAEGSVHSIGVEGAETSDLSHWNMDDDLLTRSLPRNFKLSYEKGQAELMGQDAKVKTDSGSWEVFTEPQEDELYKTTPTTSGPFDGTKPLETSIKIPSKLIKSKRVEESMTPFVRDESAMKGKSVQESLRSLTQIDPVPVPLERPSSLPGSKLNTKGDSPHPYQMSKQGENQQQSNAAIKNKTFTCQSDAHDNKECQSEILWRSHAEKGPPPPYDPDWARNRHSSARSSPLPRQQMPSVKSHVPVKAELGERIYATKKVVKTGTNSRNSQNRVLEQKVQKYKEAAGKFSQLPPTGVGIRRSQSLTSKGSLLGYPTQIAHSHEKMNISEHASTAASRVASSVHDQRRGQPMEQVPSVSRSSSVSDRSYSQTKKYTTSPSTGGTNLKQHQESLEMVDNRDSRFLKQRSHSHSARQESNKGPYSPHNSFQDPQKTIPDGRAVMMDTNIKINRDSWSVSGQSSPSYSIADSDQLPLKESTRTTRFQHFEASLPHEEIPDPYSSSLPHSQDVHSYPSFGVATSRQLPPFYARRESEASSRSSSQQSHRNYVVDDDTGEAYYRSSSCNPPPPRLSDVFDDNDDPYDDPYLYPETKTSTAAGPIRPSLQPPSHQQPSTTSSPSISSPSLLSPALGGTPPSAMGVGSAAGVVPRTTLTRSASLPRTTSGLPKRRPRYSEGSGLSAAQRLGIKTPPPARLSASTNTKPVTQDSRYDYMNQFPTVDKNISEKKPRPVREPDASYNKSLPEYLPIKSPSISDDRFDDFDFTPPVTVTATKQELTRASAIALYPFTAQSKKELSFKKGDTIYLTREIDKNWLEGEHHGNKGILPRTYVEIVTSIEEARNLQANAPSAEGKGRAKYQFKGETANELSVNKGDIIDLVRMIDANWWEVRHGNKAGIVPVAYLDVLREPQQGMSSPVPKSPIGSSSGRGPLSPMPRSPSVQAPRSPSAQAPRSPSTQAPRSPSTQVDNPLQYTSPYLTDTPALGRSQPSQQHRPGQGPRDGVQRGMQPTGGRQTQNAGSRQRLPDGERFRAVYSYKPSNDDELEIREGETVVVMEKCDDGWFVGYSESTGQFGTFPGNYVEKL
ncbi:uncharacterized protein LOC121431563 isoform X5 [Lytechinus variegatus]|uniref:uncharacterized protein LOC121431563 isoform X5 n=1 Tax=Lytechinus variegatus TaxID=7654 RepID=UPI001BB17927|nr:uncharacterized protein LOC121431563 isoform X5 [Lytechinus variegatus]